MTGCRIGDGNVWYLNQITSFDINLNFNKTDSSNTSMLSNNEALRNFRYDSIAFICGTTEATWGGGDWGALRSRHFGETFITACGFLETQSMKSQTLALLCIKYYSMILIYTHDTVMYNNVIYSFSPSNHSL